VLAAGLAAPLRAVFAQVPSVTGRVLQGAGGVLPGVVVTAIPERGGVAHTALSSPQGTYLLQDLPDGTYRIDWDLPGFDVVRRNHVEVRRDETTNVSDVVLRLLPLCECIDKWAALRVATSGFVERQGQVMDQSGRPLPHARLEVESRVGRETTYADRQGRFRVRLSPNQGSLLTSRDSGFDAVTEQVSGQPKELLMFHLPIANTRALPDFERLPPDCCFSVFMPVGR